MHYTNSTVIKDKANNKKIFFLQTSVMQIGSAVNLTMGRGFNGLELPVKVNKWM